MVETRLRTEADAQREPPAAEAPDELDPAAAAVLALQRSAGNAAVARLLAARRGSEPQPTGSPVTVQRALADDVTEAASGALDSLSGAASAALEALGAAGRAAWEGIAGAGAFLAKWGGNVISTFGDWVWDLITEAPDRIWRLLQHLGSGIAGAIDWAWRGLQAAAGPAWGALLGVAGWLGAGAGGLFGWAWEGLRRGEAWAERVLQGDLDAVRQGLAGLFAWLGEGFEGLVAWGWEGLHAVGVFISQHAPGFGKWLLEGLRSGAAWAGRLVAKLADLVGFGEIADLVFQVFKFNTRPLTPGEVFQAHQVFGDTIDYGQVRVDEFSFIAMFGEWYRGTNGMGVVLFHTINFNRPISAVSSVDDAAWLMHELTHVWQYEHVGSQYLGEAIHAQETIPNAYVYAESGSWKDDRNRTWLEAHRQGGGTFADFNREAQGDLVRHYWYRLAEASDAYDHAAWQPYIDDLRGGIG
jgi:hypothetical protein